MAYEVELKFWVADLGILEARLNGMGTPVGPATTEIDVYFAHPARDFVQTDEAFRIRQRGAENFVTYKGPKLDRTTKTRKEIDLALPEGEAVAKSFTALFESLGFRPVGTVSKLRRKFEIDWEGRRVEGSLDEIGDLGTFAELELVVETTDQIDAAKTCIGALATELQLSKGERRSYLELLLEGRY